MTLIISEIRDKKSRLRKRKRQTVNHGWRDEPHQ